MSAPVPPANERPDSADTRTELARERTALARERTFNAWLRTGLTAVAAGVGLAYLAADGHPMFALRRAAGLLLSLVGGTILVVALRRYARDAEARAHAMIPLWLLGTLVAMLFAGMLIAFYFLLFP
jgi:putative membrane protein